MGFHFKKNGIPFQKKWDSISKKMGFHFIKNGIPFHKKWDFIFQKFLIQIISVIMIYNSL